MAILTWHLLPILIGWCCFPLTKRIFPFLPGKGAGFSRVLGLLIWGYFYWLFSVLTGIRTGPWLQWFILGGLVGVSGFLAWREGFKQIWTWIKRQWRLILSLEGVFLAAYGLFLLFRAYSPAIVGTEKPMELAFLNAILRAETLPPPDPWLSGHTISYYYLGYVLVGMLADILRTPSGLAFNLAQGLWFALTAAASYGILVDLLVLLDARKSGNKACCLPRWALRAALFAPVLILVLGNVFGFLDVLHSRGIFWQVNSGDQVVSPFWSWLNLRALSEPPPQPYQWRPERAGEVGWWSASRVIQDFGWDSTPVEVIDEFPNFSFILGDLHPHVLAIPFVLMVVGLALNAFMTRAEDTWTLGRLQLPINPGRFILIAGLVGALAFINIWDWPIYAALLAAVFAIRQASSHGWGPRILWAFLLYGLGLGLTGFLLYRPYFHQFSSQASGLLPGLMYFTRGVYFWIMFGPLLILVAGYLFYLWRQGGIAGFAWRSVCRFLGALFLLLLAYNVIIGWAGSRLPGLGTLFLTNQGAAGISFSRLLCSAVLSRLAQPETTLTLSLLLVLSLGIIMTRLANDRKGGHSEPEVFVVLMILWGGLLAFIPENVYLLDFFGKRMNTIFKFYYQTWILWSLAGGFSLAVLWRVVNPGQRGFQRILPGLFVFLLLVVIVLTVFFPKLGAASVRGVRSDFGVYLLDIFWVLLGGVFLVGLVFSVLRRDWRGVFRWAAAAALGVGFIYPALAVYQRSLGFKDAQGMSLDGTQIYRQIDPDLMAAVDWLWTVEPGVIAEAVHPKGGSYSGYGRVSTLTGLPAVLGWQLHEVQWRGGAEALGSRQADIAQLYESLNWEDAKHIINMYNIHYIFIGDLERSTYAVSEAKFEANLEMVFQQGDVVIYRTEVE